ncbi:MAG: hypothetical protein ABF785_01000 [Acetobacter papayae]|uniref:NUDIX hydrolase n=1 Tax=Acetobacter papayae TaxID=1076592 RepID=UPI0039E76D69
MQAPALCETELVAVLVCLERGAPHVFTLNNGAILPSGPLMPGQLSLQKSLREWVRQQTGIQPGHTEQLYTFADTHLGDGHRRVRISYMTCLPPTTERLEGDHRPHTAALLDIEAQPADPLVSFYTYFPWEDRRNPAHAALIAPLLEGLKRWAAQDPARQQRCAITFGLAGHAWNDELALSRYELLWEVGLIPESCTQAEPAQVTGLSMQHDYRHVLATALSRIRAKIRYTSIVFDLLPRYFTLLHLQQAMEALAGRPMHKQNFRRLVLQQGLLEETEQMDFSGPGRPARLYAADNQAQDNCYLAGAKSPLPDLVW